MNNYYYIAISKALNWFGKDESMVRLCVREFNDMQIPTEFILDDKDSAILAAKENNFPSDLIKMFEV